MGYHVIICIHRCYIIQFCIEQFEAMVNTYNLMSWWTWPLASGCLFDPKWLLHGHLHYCLLKNNQVTRKKYFSSSAPVERKITSRIEGKTARYLSLPGKSLVFTPTNAEWTEDNHGIHRTKAEELYMEMQSVISHQAIS